MPEFDPALQWIHSVPATRKILAGKVTLIYFWSFSNYESLNNLVFLNQLYAVYRPYGLVVITIHVPHFEFEKSSDTISAFSELFDLDFPILLDNQGGMKALYQAFRIPSFYLINAQGKIRKTFFDNYTHEAISRSVSGLMRDNPKIILPTVTDAISKLSVTPSMFLEIPLGYQGLSHFGNLEKIRTQMDQKFAYPEYLEGDQFYLQGEWRFEADSLRALGKYSSLKIRTTFKTLSLMANRSENQILKAVITLNGVPLSNDVLGQDTFFDGTETIAKISEPRHHHFLNLQDKPDHPQLWEITFEGPADLYVISLSDMPFQLTQKKLDVDKKAAAIARPDEKVRLKTTIQE
ncbi:MAG: redoxin domain-containing protein [Candidatus Omnitrophica bacterium]|nr:redoxin domain-containing protein [Candidatus Omnitrophota bacterium]